MFSLIIMIVRILGRRNFEEEEDLQEVHLPRCRPGPAPGYAQVSREFVPICWLNTATQCISHLPLMAKLLFCI